MTRRMTDAEIALHENALGPDAEFMSPATLAMTGLLLLEELRVERERCAELRRVLERVANSEAHGHAEQCGRHPECDDLSAGGECDFHGDDECPECECAVEAWERLISDCAKALKETE